MARQNRPSLPGINRGHPAARQVLFSAVAKKSVGMVNDASRVVGTNNSLTIGTSAFIGDVLVQDGVAAHTVTFGNFTTAHLTRYTMAAIFLKTANTANNTLFLASGTGASVGLNIDANGVMLLRNVTFLGTSITYTLNVPYFVAATHDEVGGAFATVISRLDTGQIVQTSTGSNTSASSAGSGTFTLGSADSGAGAPANANIAAAMLSNTYVGFDALLRWAQDPWGFWYPPSDIAPSASVAAAVPAGACPKTLSLMGVGCSLVGASAAELYRERAGLTRRKFAALVARAGLGALVP